VYLNPTGSGVFFQSDYSGATFFGISWGLQSRSANLQWIFEIFLWQTTLFKKTKVQIFGSRVTAQENWFKYYSIPFLPSLPKFSFIASNGSRFIQQLHPIHNIDPTEPEISDLKSCGIKAKLGLFRKSPDTSQPDLQQTISSVLSWQNTELQD
jgi:hypothetical protein